MSRHFSQLGDQDQVTGDLELTDDSSNIQLQLSKGAESSVSMSYMQALTPNVTLGGMGTYSMKTSSISTGFAAILARDEHSLTAQWDSNVSDHSAKQHRAELISAPEQLTARMRFIF